MRVLIVFLILFFTQGVSGQIKIPYTFPIDTSRNISGFTTSDGTNYYVLKESVGDDCIQCLAKQPSLLTRSETLDEIRKFRRDLDYATEMTETLHKKELGHCMQQRQELQGQLEVNEKLLIDTQKKSDHWERQFKNERIKKWLGSIGFAAGGAIVAIIVTQGK